MLSGRLGFVGCCLSEALTARCAKGRGQQNRLAASNLQEVPLAASPAALQKCKGCFKHRDFRTRIGRNIFPRRSAHVAMTIPSDDLRHLRSGAPTHRYEQPRVSALSVQGFVELLGCFACPWLGSGLGQGPPQHAPTVFAEPRICSRGPQTGAEMRSDIPR